MVSSLGPFPFDLVLFFSFSACSWLLTNFTVMGRAVKSFLQCMCQSLWSPTSRSDPLPSLEAKSNSLEEEKIFAPQGE